ncbi:hypothetical protein ACAG96_04190 [Candidatus Izemoplasma sp. B36]|uniref:hypothetical protein n=1 Tax=Candidatus Izemoplasma sp. B36 TaxID=3242468 RepID=UPI0035578026
MKKALFILLFFLAFALTGCMEHIEDTNGDDTSLSSFTIQEKLDSGTISSRGSYSSASYSGSTTFATMYEDIDYDNITMSYDIFSGVSKIHATEVDDDDIFTISVIYEIISGNFEVALVNPNGLVIFQFTEENNSFTVNNAIEGIYFVIIGGESAEFDIDISRNIE